MSLLMFATGTIGSVLYVSFGAIVRLLDPDDWSEEVEFVLEVHGAASAGTFHAQLYDVTNSMVIAASEVTLSSVTKVRARSIAFSLPSGAFEYTVRFGGVEDEDYTIFDAVLIVTAA